MISYVKQVSMLTLISEKNNDLMVILENMVHFRSITICSSGASQLKDSNVTSKFTHALHPEMAGDSEA